ncbi:U-box domain-containing protein 35-like isoform X2 [Olea europaea var. sylvestris]|uniref:U-box domain-containing protein 35-like isoform X2 n=1 Tax=Olea europaea var. sylvestris TaxID=158386 RepID=UPI000C1D324B|nr:U-box domain-containing protein 35-like isoform X2 [Olea europaea var. sylvestris]
MSQKGNNGDKKEEMVAVAIDKDKGSQAALKWAVDNLLSKGKRVTLIHVKQKTSIAVAMGSQASLCDKGDVANTYKGPTDSITKEMFLPYRCFCTRKNIIVTEIVLEDTDIARALCDYVKNTLLETLVLGAPSRSSFVRFRSVDVPSSVSKGAPEFCTVYVISKGKISNVRSASIALPNQPPRPLQNQTSLPLTSTDPRPLQSSTRGNYVDKVPFSPVTTVDDKDSIKSPFTRSKVSNRSYSELSAAVTDISFVSSGMPSTDRTTASFDSQEINIVPRLSNSSDTDGRLSFGSPFSGSRSSDPNSSFGVFSSSSLESGNFSWSGSQNLDEVEAEMRRLKQELKQTMEMYSSACKEAFTAKQKALELHRWKAEEQQRLEKARLAEEAALVIAEKEKAKCKAALEKAEAAQRIAELEARKRIDAETKALKESEERRKVLDKLVHNDVRYRKYSIEEIEAATDHFSESHKIGEGGYGPVYKCYLDHTQVAVKVLRPDAAQGRSQFQQEVEVLSNIRHPNMVLLLGACPEYGCLVYEYMANGSLDDRLFRRENTPVLPWQLRFRIAAEIGTSLLFLHQTKPEPLVHRDLKPGNILLDRNFVSKISDVGLARLVPPNIADSVTQYHMTSAAGTFCYIDPEYQQTGMLGIKSDVYSLGVMLLQMITARPPMGLTHHVERAIEKGTFVDMLDPAVPDWPVEEALKFAKLALKCTELRRKDRPDLGSVVLPELNMLRALAEETIPNITLSNSPQGNLSQIQSSSRVS